nr:MAG TPA: hypothetical protein [Bacteriophage sp.]
MTIKPVAGVMENPAPNRASGVKRIESISAISRRVDGASTPCTVMRTSSVT